MILIWGQQAIIIRPFTVDFGGGLWICFFSDFLIPHRSLYVIGWMDGWILTRYGLPNIIPGGIVFFHYYFYLYIKFSRWMVGNSTFCYSTHENP